MGTATWILAMLLTEFAGYTTPDDILNLQRIYYFFTSVRLRVLLGSTCCQQASQCCCVLLLQLALADDGRPS